VPHLSRLNETRPENLPRLAAAWLQEFFPAFREYDYGELFAAGAGPHRAELKEPLGAKGGQILLHQGSLSLIAVALQVVNGDGSKPSDIVHRFKFCRTHPIQVAAHAHNVVLARGRPLFGSWILGPPLRRDPFHLGLLPVFDVEIAVHNLLA
jgi:hypothetical protein